MRKITTFLSAIFLGLVVFCVPVMDADASTHHMPDSKVKFDCDSDENSHFNCCFSDNSRNEKFVFTDRTVLKTYKFLKKNVDFDWSTQFEAGDLYKSLNDRTVSAESVNFLIGTTIKRE